MTVSLTKAQVEGDSSFARHIRRPTGHKASESTDEFRRSRTSEFASKIKAGEFTCTEGTEKKSKVSRLIESKAAKILGEAMRDSFAYAAQAAVWHRWHGTHWQPMESPADLDQQVTEAMYRGTEPVGFKPAYQAGVVKIVQQSGVLELPSPQPGRIPFCNGILDTATGSLSPITRATALSWTIPHSYVTGAECPPLFGDWIQSASGGDSGLIGLLRAFLNACLVGREDLQNFLHLVGPGGTGKSTFNRLLFALLGDQNCTISTLRDLEQNRFETAALYGKRLLSITDSDRYGGAVNVLKAVTGRDPLRNERKHVQQAGTFTFHGQVLILSNQHLDTTDRTSGFDRRRIVVSFDRVIPADEREAFARRGGESALHAEIPAVISWALRMSRDDVTRAFLRPPVKSNEAAFEALICQNSIAAWVTENLAPDPHGSVQVGVRSSSEGGRTFFSRADDRLYPNYLRWCHEHKREPVSLTRFSGLVMEALRMLSAGASKARSGKLGAATVKGIRILGEHEEPFDWQSRRVTEDYKIPGSFFSSNAY